MLESLNQCLAASVKLTMAEPDQVVEPQSGQLPTILPQELDLATLTLRQQLQKYNEPHP